MLKGEAFDSYAGEGGSDLLDIIDLTSALEKLRELPGFDAAKGENHE